MKGVRCPYCGSKNVYGISRVVGYFSKIDDWNKSKTAEFRDRQNGEYTIRQIANNVRKKGNYAVKKDGC